MSTRFVKEGNAFYEIDEDCLKRKEEERKKEREKKNQLSELETGEEKKQMSTDYLQYKTLK